MDIRRELKELPKRIVVKIGSNGIADPSGIHKDNLKRFTKDICELLDQDIELVLVSSGAIATGHSILGSEVQGGVDVLQALSALGQPPLIAAYQANLAKFNRNCAQVLLTHEDLADRQRSLNLRNTLLRLLEMKVVPIVNENDSVSYAEITVGDNDQLAAMLAMSLDANLLILLTGPDGLYTKNPETPGAEKISHLSAEDDFKRIWTHGQSSSGRGGMSTKLEAVRRVTPLGIPVVIASYNNESPITQALEGAGSFFYGATDSFNLPRERWLVSSVKAGAKIQVDQGAEEAILHGASLLPSGISQCYGTFRRGDCVSIIHRGKVLALGLSEYSSREVEKIKGCKSSDIAKLLGSMPSKVVIHRKNLVKKGS